VAAAVDGVALVAPTRSSRRGPRAWREADRLTQAAALWLAFLVIVGFTGSLLPFGDPRAIGAGPRLASPSAEWLFGTDELGRPLLPRVAEGVRTTILVAFLSVALTTVIGGLIGMLAGYKRGLVDAVVSRVTDVLFAFPALVLALLTTVVVGYGGAAAVVSIVLITTPLMIRVVRAATFVVSERDFVVVARVQGASLRRIMFVHIAPNVAGPIATQAAYALSLSMLIESGLSFLGFGVQPPDASLGSLVRDGTQYLTRAPWLVFIPGAVLASAILAVSLIGDGLRDALDPQKPRSLE
jgi:peptide/nickel transport system permease protein